MDDSRERLSVSRKRGLDPVAIRGFGFREVGRMAATARIGARHGFRFVAKGSKNDRGQRGRERGEPGATGPQTGERVEFSLRTFDPAQDLLGSGGEQSAGLGEPDPPTGPLE